MVTDQELFNYAVLAFFLISLPTSIYLRYLTSPYCKHRRPGWRRTIPAPLAWFLMDSPTLWLTSLLFPLGQNHSNPKALILVSLYLTHYFHRTVLYPIRLFLRTPRRQTSNDFPISIAFLAFVFNLLNVYLQVRWVTHYAAYEGDKWSRWRFAGGLAVFVIGMAVTVTSDYTLLGLKSEPGGGHRIPRGGLFELVSCPNYFGEMLEWLGWALMTWGWAGFGFFLYSSANLVLRGVSKHQWYLQKVGEDYPKRRKAVIPFVC